MCVDVLYISNVIIVAKCPYGCVLMCCILAMLLLQRHAKMDVRASNNIVHLWTCSDSCFALAELINYLSKDGDLTSQSQQSADSTATPVSI